MGMWQVFWTFKQYSIVLNNNKKNIKCREFTIQIGSILCVTSRGQCSSIYHNPGYLPDGVHFTAGSLCRCSFSAISPSIFSVVSTWDSMTHFSSMWWLVAVTYACALYLHCKSFPFRQSGFFDMASWYAIRPVKRTSSTVDHVYVSTEIISVISTDFSLCRQKRVGVSRCLPFRWLSMAPALPL